MARQVLASDPSRNGVASRLIPWIDDDVVMQQTRFRFLLAAVGAEQIVEVALLGRGVTCPTAWACIAGEEVNPDLEVTPVDMTATFEHPANDWRPPIKLTWYQGAHGNEAKKMDPYGNGHGAPRADGDAYIDAHRHPGANRQPYAGTAHRYSQRQRFLQVGAGQPPGGPKTRADQWHQPRGSWRR